MTDDARASVGPVPADASLTIGQLAAYTAVTVRAVRHYHQRGLLAEPERDASGYRRYGARAVLDLLKIRTLSEAGVPLARVQELLEVPQPVLAEAVQEIEDDLDRQISELQLRRERLTALGRGENALLPGELGNLLETLRAAGVSEWALRAERDGWVLILARYPVRGRELLLDKISWLAAPTALRQYVLYDQAQHWEPDDPRLREVADEIIGTLQPTAADLPEGWQEEDAELARMLTVLFTAAKTPALLQLEQMLAEGHPR
ncbi:MerR family transcriptional regulator [Kineosporia rhizophila]|uniref:MerR family transcriptional regulator n=1 Tax=Kineosporia TaxID=49184 RepID=UPI000ADB7F3C|nr:MULTISPECIES: MerR family transcriptional regulator [Kineosporia]MCE0535771.1 MerR family transcriptional regulator [Kineosporia rhizophila]GLY18245.1 MerR family transcriptional regulator [Kineosporia sp. NBRC 101677]